MSWWRNAAYTAIKTGHAGNLTLQMEQAWRWCIRNGGAPDFNRDDNVHIVTPTRPNNTLALYAMITVRCALTMSRANAHAVLAIQ